MTPSSDRFGLTAGPVHRCIACGHGAVADAPEEEVFEGAYADAVDEVSLEEEEGQVATARRDLARIERWVRPGRLLDVGCWTGSLLVAARERGWQAAGLEPSEWASARARARGCDVTQAVVGAVPLDADSYRAVVATDVIEHLTDPNEALLRIRGALEPGGVLFVTVPDAGSLMARVLGRRWWSVLPMHLHYFTRGSMRALLERSGFDVLDVTTHPKVFSVGYYAGRLAAFAPFMSRLVRASERRGLSERPVAPNFRDRMAVIARRPERDTE